MKAIYYLKTQLVQTFEKISFVPNSPRMPFYSFCISGIGKEEEKKGKKLSHITGSKDVFFKLTEAPKPPQFINLSGDYVHSGDSMGPCSASSAMKAVSARTHSHCWEIGRKYTLLKHSWRTTDTDVNSAGFSVVWGLVSCLPSMWIFLNMQSKKEEAEKNWNICGIINGICLSSFLSLKPYVRGQEFP